MALIKCPECGKEVSDRAKECIHCGCPLNDEKYKIILLDYNSDTAATAGINTVFGWNLPYESVMELLNNLPYTLAEYDSEEEMKHYALELKDMRWGLEFRCETPDGKNIYIDNANNIKCPTCGSKQISRVGTSSKIIGVALFGVLSNKRKKTFHCNKCGYEW